MWDTAEGRLPARVSVADPRATGETGDRTAYGGGVAGFSKSVGVDHSLELL